MDKRLQRLRREAVTTNDYAVYDAALQKAGLCRITLTKLILLRKCTGYKGVESTLWAWREEPDLTRQGTFRIACGDFIFPAKVELGFSWGDRDGNFFRIIDIETKELVLPIGYFDLGREDATV